MKQLSLFSTLFFLLSLMASCGGEETYIPFQSSDHGKWGMLNSDGDIIFESEFDNCPTIPLNDRFFVKNGDGLLEIYTLDKKPKLVSDGYMSVAPFVNDVTVAVKPGENVSIIDKNGKVVKVLDKIANHNIKAVNMFYGELAVFTIEKNDKYYFGCINTNGDVVIEPKYAYLCNSNSGYLVAISDQEYRLKDKYVWSIIKANGKEVFSSNSKEYRIFDDEDLSLALEQNVIPVIKNGNLGLLSINGKELIKPTSKIDAFTEFTDDRIIYRNGGEYGIMSYDGEIVVRPKYQDLIYANDGLFWAAQDDSEKIYLLDKNGEKVNEDSAIKKATPFYGDYALVNLEENEWVFYNHDLKELKQKNAPDISNIEAPYYGRNAYKSYGSDWIESDFVDLGRVVSSLKITSRGLYGWTLDMLPQQAANALAEKSPMIFDGTPDDLTDRYRLSYNDIIEKLRINYEIKYSQIYNTEYTYSYVDSYSYYGRRMDYVEKRTWATDTPESIVAEIGSLKSAEQSKRLIQIIIDELKTKGKMYRSNVTAALVNLGNKASAITFVEQDKNKVVLIFANKEAGELMPLFEQYKSGGANSRDNEWVNIEAVDSCAADTAAVYDY
ncbi:MAG: WG repeat-containing protein [Muribaculaceae bacterium]